MKTMTKKCGVYATFAVVLLTMAALVTGCSTGSSGENEYQPPAGLGAVKLNLDNITRTIVPGTKVTDFNSFDVQFSPASTGGNGAVALLEENRTPANVGGPYDLSPGKYDITVIGYIGSSSTKADNEAAEGKVSNITVTVSSVIPTPTITLKGLDPVTSTGTGTFDWLISNGVSGLTAATMTFTKIAGTGTAPLPVDLYTTNQWHGSITNFPAGYYYVDFVLTAKSTNKTFRHILHIYQNMTSSFEYLFNNDYFTFAQITLPITVGPFDGKPELKYGISNTLLAEEGIVTVSFSAAGGNPASTTITVTNATDYDSIAWYYGSVALVPLTTTPPVSGTKGEILTVDTTAAPFNIQGKSQLTIVGIIGGIPYTTTVYISVLP